MPRTKRKCPTASQSTSDAETVEDQKGLEEDVPAAKRGERKLKRSMRRQDLFEASEPEVVEYAPKDPETGFFPPPAAYDPPSEAKEGIIIEQSPRVKGPPHLKEYLARMLKLQNPPETEEFHVWNRNDYTNPADGQRFVSYKFAKGNWCPVCWLKCGYGFDYKVRSGCYGGWKCWKTGGFITSFDDSEVEELFEDSVVGE